MRASFRTLPFDVRACNIAEKPLGTTTSIDPFVGFAEIVEPIHDRSTVAVMCPFVDERSSVDCASRTSIAPLLERTSTRA